MENQSCSFEDEFDSTSANDSGSLASPNICTLCLDWRVVSRNVCINWPDWQWQSPFSDGGTGKCCLRVSPNISLRVLLPDMNNHFRLGKLQVKERLAVGARG